MIITAPPGATLWSLAATYYGSGQYWALIWEHNQQLPADPYADIGGQQVELQPQDKNAQLALLGLAGAEGLLVLAIAAVLASAVDIHVAMDRLEEQLVENRIPLSAAQGGIAIVLQLPGERLGATGPATRTVMLLNLVRRAQFTLNAIKRIAAAVADARAHDGDLERAFYNAVEQERRWYAQHLMANWNRADAAARVDSSAAEYGLLLGWNTVLDSHTSAECRQADRHNFWADAMPLIGYPGMVHLHCRCFPGRPYKGAPILPSSRMGALRAPLRRSLIPA